jgi:hypothetical protein
MPSAARTFAAVRLVSTLVVGVAFLDAASHLHLWSDHTADQPI